MSASDDGPPSARSLREELANDEVLCALFCLCAPRIDESEASRMGAPLLENRQKKRGSPPDLIGAARKGTVHLSK